MNHQAASRNLGDLSCANSSTSMETGPEEGFQTPCVPAPRVFQGRSVPASDWRDQQSYRAASLVEPARKVTQSGQPSAQRGVERPRYCIRSLTHVACTRRWEQLLPRTPCSDPICDSGDLDPERVYQHTRCLLSSFQRTQVSRISQDR